MKYKILVVDDEKEPLEEAQKWLLEIAANQRDAVEVLIAADVSEGIALLSQHPDVIITDYHFESGLSGDALIDRIADPFRTKLVILMSKYDTTALRNVIRKRHKHLGERFRFLQKKFSRLELESKYFEIEQFFLNLPYPVPLEYTRQFSTQVKGGVQRLLVNKDFIETFLKYTAAVLMSDLAQKKAVNSVTLKIDMSAELTLGAWIEWSRSALQAIGANSSSSFMPELGELFTHENSDFSKLIEKFREIRNRNIHDYTKVDEKYDLDAETYLPVIKSFMRALSFLSRYPVFVPFGLDFTPDNERYVYAAKILMGTDAIVPQTELITSEKLKLHRVYSYSPSGMPLALYPLVQYKLCGSCGAPAFFLLDRITPSECLYKATCNHRFSDKQAKIDFDQRIGPLFIKSQATSS